MQYPHFFNNDWSVNRSFPRFGYLQKKTNDCREATLVVHLGPFSPIYDYSTCEDWIKVSAVFSYLFFYSLAGIYLLKVNKRNTRTMSKICSKLTIKTPERSLYCWFWRDLTPSSGASIVDFEQVNTGWDYVNPYISHPIKLEMEPWNNDG